MADELNRVLVYLHPVLAGLILPLALGVASLGWHYRLRRARTAARRHARLGSVLLGALVLSWLLGLAGVLEAGLPGVSPGGSGHFIVGSVLLLGFTLSTWLMVRYGVHAWARRLHVALNGLLVVLLLYQGLLGVNRLYKFNLLGPVPQAHEVRRLLAIKFGLASPPVTARADQTYAWTKVSAGSAFGGAWRSEPGAIREAGDHNPKNRWWDFLSAENRFSLLVFREPVFGDGEFAIEFEIGPGLATSHAGLAFRVVDEHNYYVACAASDQRVTLMRWNNGSRQALFQAPAAVNRGRWHSLRVVASGNELTVLLDGRLVGTAKDDGWKTGGWGLGTKADCVTRFRHIRAVGR